MVSVVIPTYKNKEQLFKNLKKNLPFLTGCEIIIVNDDPHESIQEDMKQFPQVTLLENKTNLGFGQTVNKGIAKAKHDCILLLNNDVILRDASFKKAVVQFKNNPQLFAISFAQVEASGKTIGRNTFYWENGFFYHQSLDSIEFGFNGWAEGGSCLIDKDKFNELHGFDPLFTPFYWEDTDLSYRAWKKGYKVVFEPDIVVDHHHSSTIGKYIDVDFKNSIAARNHYIFIWKNISDSNLILSHILLLPYHLLYFSFKNTYLVKGFLKAIIKLIPIILSRRKNHNEISDKEVLAIFK